MVKSTTVQEASSLSGLWWITPVTLVLFASLFGFLSWRLWRTRPRVEPARQERQAADNQF